MKTNSPTYKCNTELVFNSMVSFEENRVIIKDFAPKEVAMLFYQIEPEDVKIIYEMSNPVCECGNNLHKHAIIDWKMDDEYPIFKYQYRCPKCRKTIITPLLDIVDKGCTYTKDIKDEVVNLYAKEHISYAHSRDFLNEKYGLDLTRQSVFNFNDKESDEYLTEREDKIQEKIKDKNIEPTGYPGHDEAFFKINGEKHTLFAMIDSNNQHIINDQITPESEYRDLLETFIIYSLKDLSVYNDPNTPNPPHPLLLPDLKKQTLIGDGLPEYPKIAKKANINFHPCDFHIIMNQRKPSWKRQRILENKKQSNLNKIKKNEEKIKKYYAKYPIQKKIKKLDTKRRKQKDKVTEMERENKRLRSENRKLKKQIDEYEDCNERISEIFNQDTIKDAKRRFNILYNQKQHLPDEITKFLVRLEKDLDSALSHIENEMIPKTNNWLELFFKIVFPKKYRNRFKTLRGVKRFLRSGKIKWYENVVLKEKINIKPINAWSKLKQRFQPPNSKINW